jgi:RNA polymerase sigma-70 factor (ECF subfamily)
VFGRLLQALYEGDADALSEVLAPDVRYVADADGRYQSVGIPVQGRDRVARVLLGLRRFLTDGDEVTLRPTACGVAMVLRRRAPKGRQPPMAATLLSVDGRGRIEGVYTVLVPEKLATVASDSVSSGRR